MPPQISLKWRVPVYAQGLLIPGSDESFAYIHWVDGDGPTLAYWALPESETEAINNVNVSFEWDGRVIVGGFVERLHVRRLGDVELVIAEIVGGVFPANYRNLPTLADMREGVFARPADFEPSDDDHTYPFVMEADSAFASLAQDALVSGLAVDAVGRLADDAQGFHDVCGLPLMLESLTLLASD
jgi:hypothetical protein